MPNTLFHLQFPAPEAPKEFSWDTLFESVDGFYKQDWLAAGFYVNESNLWLYTAATLNSRELIFKSPLYTNPVLTWLKKRTLKTSIRAVQNTGGSSRFIVQTGAWDSNCGFGFNILSNKIYGMSGNGTTLSSIELETIPAGAFDITRRLEAIWNYPTNIEFYVDDVLKGTKTTHLPTGVGGAPVLLRAEAWALSAHVCELYISKYRITQAEL